MGNLRPSTADSVRSLFAIEPEGANREERFAGSARVRTLILNAIKKPFLGNLRSAI
jgi:hypothetical protein